MNITLKGRIPSKKNSKRLVPVHGRIMILSSEDYQEWHEYASFQLLAFKRPKKPIEQCKLEVVIYAPDKRKSDLSNKFESIADLLVDNLWLQDDSWFVCHEINIKFGGVDKSNPRAEIKIYEIPSKNTK